MTCSDIARGTINSILVGFLFILHGLGQTAPSSSQPTLSADNTTPPAAAQLQTLGEAYQRERAALVQEEQSLIAGGATEQQLSTWRNQAAARLLAQKVRAEAMAVLAGLQLRPINTKANIPRGASPSLKAFLLAQAALANTRARLHNQLVQQAQKSGNVTFAQLKSLQDQESALFQQQNAAALETLAQWKGALTATAAQTSLSTLKFLAIPANASPQKAAFLRTQNKIMEGLGQVRSQYSNATPAQRQAALEEWRQQHANLFAQMRQDAQNLAQSLPQTQPKQNN